MSTKGWRPYWTNPGLSEISRPVLYRTINRDLHVKRNLTIGGNFSWLGSWESYTPTIRGYTLGSGTGGAGGGTLATGIVYTATGIWRKLDTIIFFDAVVQVALPRSGDWRNNMYVDL